MPEADTKEPRVDQLRFTRVQLSGEIYFLKYCHAFGPLPANQENTKVMISPIVSQTS